MKLRLLSLAGVVALIAMTAIAAPASGKGKPPKTGVGCRPYVSIILKGTLAADGSASSVSVNVTGGNFHAKAYKAASPVTVTVTTATKVIRSGKKSATDLKKDDLVNIQARACKADLANDATPALTAVRITAHAPSSDSDD